MLIEVKVPMLAESIAEATLMKWHKKQGEPVKRGDSLIDIETDKVTLEVAASYNGVLIEILKKDGENVGSNEIIARIETETTVNQPSVSSLAVNSPPTEEKLEPNIPEQVSLDISISNDAEEPVALPVLATQQMVNEDLPRLSPAVKNMMSQFDLDAQQIEDQNNDGRVTKADVINHLEKGNNSERVSEHGKTTETPDAITLASVERPSEQTTVSVSDTHIDPLNTEKSLEKTKLYTSTNKDTDRVRRVPMTQLRKRVAERLLSAQQSHAILTTFNEVNLQPVMELRDKYREEFLNTHGVKLGYMSFFTKASIEALKKFPLLNASTQDADILYHDYFDIGIAVSTERGLVVPIIRNADALSLAQLEAAIIQIGDKARQGKLSIEDLTGGTFSITNGGIFGSLLSTPILNPPQSAILGMHKIEKRPIVENDQIIIRPMMYLALSYDHRIIDGKDAVQFLITIKELLQDPARLLLQI